MVLLKLILPTASWLVHSLVPQNLKLKMSKTEYTFPLQKDDSSLLINETAIHRVRKLKGIHHVPLPRPPSFLINMTDTFLTGHPESVITLSPTLHSPSLWNQTLQKPPKSTGWSLNSRVEYTNLVFWEFLLLSALKKLYLTYLGLLTAFTFLLYSYAFYSFDNVEKAMEPHFSALAWKIPWMEEPGRLQSMGSLRVGHDWATWLSVFTFMHWRWKWQPTPVFLAGESQGWRSPVGCHLWGRITDTSEVT